MPSNHVEFTREMREAGYTILVPNMLEFHFSLIVKVLRLNGYNAELLTNRRAPTSWKRARPTR